MRFYGLAIRCLTARPMILGFGGGRGIRTHGTFRSFSFQDCCLKPLGQPARRGLSTRYVREDELLDVVRAKFMGGCLTQNLRVWKPHDHDPKYHLATDSDQRLRSPNCALGLSGCSSVVERGPPKPSVGGSIPSTRANRSHDLGWSSGKTSGFGPENSGSIPGPRTMMHVSSVGRAVGR